jgi:hypothetical protein
VFDERFQLANGINQGLVTFRQLAGNDGWRVVRSAIVDSTSVSKLVVTVSRTPGEASGAWPSANRSAARRRSMASAVDGAPDSHPSELALRATLSQRGDLLWK